MGHLWQQEVTNTRSKWPMTLAASPTSPLPASPRRLEERHDPFRLRYPQARHKDLTLWDDGLAVYSADGAPAAVMNIGRVWTATSWGPLWFWCRSNAIADCLSQMSVLRLTEMSRQVPLPAAAKSSKHITMNQLNVSGGGLVFLHHRHANR